MEPDPLPPPLGEGPVLVVGGQDAGQMGGAEQGQHGEVGFPVTPVGRRVDEPGAVVPQHVARPQVAVNAARRLGGCLRAGAGALDRQRLGRCHRAEVLGPAKEREDALVGVEGRPVVRPVVGHRERSDETGPGCTEPRRTGGVQISEVAPEGFGLGRAGGHVVDAGEDEAIIVHGHDGDDPYGSGVRQPPQTGDFGGPLPGAGAFDDDRALRLRHARRARGPDRGRRSRPSSGNARSRAPRRSTGPGRRDPRRPDDRSCAGGPACRPGGR